MFYYPQKKFLFCRIKWKDRYRNNVTTHIHSCTGTVLMLTFNVMILHEFVFFQFGLTWFNWVYFVG